MWEMKLAEMLDELVSTDSTITPFVGRGGFIVRRSGHSEKHYLVSRDGTVAYAVEYRKPARIFDTGWAHRRKITSERVTRAVFSAAFGLYLTNSKPVER